MWLFTKFGFFSIVQKDHDQDNILTIRSRTRGDLDRLRNHYLPSLSSSRAHEGTDYPWRANASAAALKEAMSTIVQEIDYSNFKSEVGLSTGHARAKRYNKVWSAMYDMPEDLPEPHATDFEGLPWSPPSSSKSKAVAYGGVVIDPHGYLLMREVKNHFDGYVWTFAKGRQDKGESPRETALREVWEEMGVDSTILIPIAGEFAGGTTLNRFFLMVVDRGTVNLGYGNDETERLCWATPAEAERLIAQTSNPIGRSRDLAILKAAQDSLPKMLPLARPVACRSDWHSLPMPASRITVPLETCYSPSEMAAIVCGSLPISQDDKWFIFYEDGVLHCHRSATGICLYRVYFQPTATGWQASQVEINRHPGQHTESNDSMNLALLDSIMDALRLMRPI
ncbi:NUDIX domain-containing protein (plasmid) [Aeromonas media]|uniref:NUDIX domain-containing protein n=1 Tax=Aeromonas media TaxID=651 RepID=UPI001912C435|nr:NUDIX domain-containing protein [Aeromonas media]QQQ15887.1 NUDIX domain-containing protein [Aeromonas media]